MKLKKCPICKIYTLEEKCPTCKKESHDAHYKFKKVRDAPKTDINYLKKH